MNPSATPEYKPCLIEYGKFRIVIMDEKCTAYIKELKTYGVTDVVRACEPTYDAEEFEREQIRVHEMMFSDGAAPPEDTMRRWLDLIDTIYRPNPKTAQGVVAVHCVAGLGRAPVMAAVALIEMTAMDPMDVVMKIREKKKGAFNKKQLEFLQAYKPRRRGANRPCQCVMM